MFSQYFDFGNTCYAKNFRLLKLIKRVFRFSGGKYEPSYSTIGYKIHMKLTIKAVTRGDYGHYKCVSKNSLGDTDGTIQVFGELIKLIF